MLYLHSAGVGRAGCYILIDMTLNRLEKCEYQSGNMAMAWVPFINLSVLQCAHGFSHKLPVHSACSSKENSRNYCWVA